MRISFRPLSRADLPMLGQWLERPHVAHWWREPADPESVERNYGPAIDRKEPTELFVVGQDGRDIGLLQRYRIADYPAYAAALRPSRTPSEAASIDYLIADPALIGQGLGPALIRHAAEAIWGRYPDAPAIVVAVQQDNRQSWRALEKAGFRRIWAGHVRTGDPSDDGPGFVYQLDRRPQGSAASP